MEAQVKWMNAKSAYFKVTSGTKQGGVISPHFYGIYIDDLAKILRKRKIGCHLIGVFVACLIYADDLALMAPLRSAMQLLIDMCVDYANQFCLLFNFKKTKAIVFGRRKSSPCPLQIQERIIEYLDEWDYLGVWVKAGNHNTGWIYFPITPRKFYAKSNSIIHGKLNLDKSVMMQLLYTNCVPTLTFAAEARQLIANDMRSLNTAVNNAVQCIFSYACWERIHTLRMSYGYNSLYEIFEKRRGLSNHSNRTVKLVYNFLVAGSL